MVTIFGINSINQGSSGVNKTVITESVEAEAAKHDIIETLTAPGEVKSEKEETLKLNTKYYYSTICAEENEKVKKGANLLKYSNGTYLKAPYDCVVISSDLPDEDEVCTTSNYVEVQSLHTLSMELNISETDINKVSIGDVVDITLTSGGDVVEGNITSISEKSKCNLLMNLHQVEVDLISLDLMEEVEEAQVQVQVVDRCHQCQTCHQVDLAVDLKCNRKVKA